jgi:hypothetical protein
MRRLCNSRPKPLPSGASEVMTGLRNGNPTVCDNCGGQGYTDGGTSACGKCFGVGIMTPELAKVLAPLSASKQEIIADAQIKQACQRASEDKAAQFISLCTDIIRDFSSWSSIENATTALAQFSLDNRQAIISAFHFSTIHRNSMPDGFNAANERTDRRIRDLETENARLRDRLEGRQRV